MLGPVSVHLTADASVLEDRLVVEFTLFNHGVPVFAYVYPDDGMRERVLRNAAYVSLSQDLDALHVDLLPPPPPLDVDFEVGVLSLAVLLSSGEERTERIELPLPVREWSPYDLDDSPTQSGPVEVQVVRFRTCVFPEAGAHWREEGPEPQTWWTEGEPLVELSSILELVHPVPVWKRSDDFTRY